MLIPQGHKFRLSRQTAQLSFIPQGHKFRLSRQAAQLSFIPQGYKFRFSRQAAQLSLNQKGRNPDKQADLTIGEISLKNQILK
jgi:hypothetical protein